MICPTCRAAADAGIEDDNDAVDGVLLGVFQRELHDQCRGGGWCDCQHRVAAAGAVTNGDPQPEG